VEYGGNSVVDSPNPAQTQPPAVSRPGRAANGRFAKGNKAAKGGGGGRPHAYAQDYQAEMRSALDMATWRGVIDKAIAQALDGDNRARLFLASYVMGQPVQQVVADLTGSRDRLMSVLGEIEASLPEVEDGGA